MIKWENKPSFGKTAVLGTIELDLDPVRGKQGSYNLHISEIGAQGKSWYGRPYNIIADSIDIAEQEAVKIVTEHLIRKIAKHTKYIKHYEKIINIVKEK